MEFLQSFTFTVVDGLSVLSVFGQCLLVILIICLLVEKLSKRTSPFVSWFTRHGLLLMFIVALTATSGSLFFSDIAGWTPCKSCWLQRIVMYPQVVIVAIALWKKDRTAATYILALSLIGIVLSAGHYVEQVQAALRPIADATKPCDESGVSCAATQIHFTFGYITIPMMALTAFLLNTLGSILLLSRKKEAQRAA